MIVPESELVEKFLRASGPGGQNVNKVSSAVQLSFDVAASRALSPAEKAAILASGDRRLTRHGVLIIVAQRFRAQERNRADARLRLADAIARALRPRKPRRATKPPKAAKRRRLEAKKRRGLLKQSRSRPEAG